MPAKKTTGGKVSDRAEKSAYALKIAEFCAEKVAHDIHRGVVTRSVAMDLPAGQGSTAGGFIQVFGKIYDPESLVDDVDQELARLNAESE